MDLKFDFNHVMLLPRECVVESRGDTDVSAKLGKRTFRIPLMAANMPSIIDETIAIELAKRNYFYVMHRVDIDILQFVAKMKSLGLFTSIAIGIKKPFHDLIDKLHAEGLVPDYVTIDLANGHCQRTKLMIEHLRSKFGDETFIIAGNVATQEAVIDLESWGADATRVGLGPGYVCTTSPRTGFGSRGWQLSAIADCAKVAKKVIIADGGVRSSGDIAKAIHFGAHWVMSGLFFTGHKESPGEVVVENNVTYKTYYGNASAQCKQSNSRIEGRSTLIPVETSLYDKLIEVEEDLQSAVSFSGGTKLEDITKVDHVFIR
ncbi:guanosine monophosphate reductase, putative [Theileria equi strain WA]|uniref:GMP reductase n=1 Tax=Theileria equi strain WA TaxID=1537102 RepID=L0AY93_THEEQ|nr:guanosine monophosphate reductase, putative [Theileria equi strain WA]AFZ80228.1 guanosine monophosphate reductase, putative [Theileria equi strain WA]|eukprot:XP_004829894.1 guanosine monophosphate reductase, putative [Theileria equi strain WA]